MTQARLDESGSLGALGDFSVLRIAGPDAVAFAHAQLANDVRALADRGWQWNCLLNPQGRTLALMLLARIDAHELRAMLPARAAEAVRAHLARYVLRSKVALAIDPAPPQGAFGETPGPLPGGGDLEARSGGWCARLGGSADRRVVLAGTADAGAIDPARWAAADVADGLPWLVDQAIGAHVPHALGLAALPALSTTKGCYPGQEIVARTHFLGRNKRRLARFAGSGASPPAIGARILAPDGGGEDALGHVVTAVELGDAGFCGLAVVREDAPDRLRVEGAPPGLTVELTPAARAAAGAPG